VSKSNTLDRLAPLSGIAMVVLIIASFAITGETPDIGDSATSVASWWNDHRTEAQWGSLVLMWAAFFAVMFGAVIRSTLRRAGEAAERVAAVAMTGWTMFAIGALAFAGFNFAAADASDHANVDPVAIQALSILGDDFFPILAIGLAVAMLSTGVGTLRHGILPKWLGWVAVAIGLSALTPAGWFGFMATGIWAIIAAVVLYTRGGAAAPAAAPPA
jgi:hypothetical protein